MTTLHSQWPSPGEKVGEVRGSCSGRVCALSTQNRTARMKRETGTYDLPMATGEGLDERRALQQRRSRYGSWRWSQVSLGAVQDAGGGDGGVRDGRSAVQMLQYQGTFSGRRRGRGWSRSWKGAQCRVVEMGRGPGHVWKVPETSFRRVLSCPLDVHPDKRRGVSVMLLRHVWTGLSAPALATQLRQAAAHTAQP